MIKLYNKDCMEALKEMKENQFDLAIVDPPYGTGQIKNTLHGKLDWNDTIPNQKYFTELKRVSKNQIIWGVNYFDGFGLNGGRIVWNKLITPIFVKTFSHCEIAYCSSQKRVTIYEYQWSGNVQGGKMNCKNIGKDRRIHPTQKPISLYEWILMNYAKEGDKILDTHLGSGSIAIACHNLGFDLEGYELDNEYFEAAQKRLKQHQSQMQLFL